MLRPKYFVFGVTVCILLTSGSGALPVESGSVDYSSTSPEDAAGLVMEDPSEPSDHHSKILSMLGALKGGNEINNLESLLKGYSVMREGLKFVFKLSPLFTRLFETVSKTNPAMRTIIKVSQGHVPDVVDIYDLATNSRKKHIGTDLVKAETNDKQYLEFTHYAEQVSTLNSSTDIKNMVKLLTGKDVPFTQQVVDAVNEGNVVITKENIGQVNLLYFVDFVVKNYQYMTKSIGSLTLNQNRNLIIQILQFIIAIDPSPLTKIKVMKEPLDNDKYSINGGKPTFLPDPDVAPIVADYASAKKMSKERNVDLNKVISLIADLLKHEAQLLEQLLEGTTADISSKTVGSVVG